MTYIHKIAFVFACILSALAPAQAATISSYDITNARSSGFGGWSHSYFGTITPNGSLVNYSGGSGTLNDNIIPTSPNANELFWLADNTSITLHLSNVVLLSTINIFGGNYFGNSIPGTITGATVTIGNTSIALVAQGFGPSCSNALCNDALNLFGTGLENIATNTVTLSNFTGTSGYFNIGEIGIVANNNVPEPTTVALLGFGLLGFAALRKRSFKS